MIGCRAAAKFRLGCGPHKRDFVFALRARSLTTNRYDLLSFCVTVQTGPESKTSARAELHAGNSEATLRGHLGRFSFLCHVSRCDRK
jgi:hypothetical protein